MGKESSEHHEPSQSDIEHVKNSILIEKYSPYYDAHLHSPYLSKLIHKIMPHHHHDPIIDQKSVESPSYASLSESEVTNRATYALWKIRQVNPHFFSPSEQATIDNREMRILRFTFKYSCLAALTGYAAFCVRHNRLNLKRSLFMAAAYGSVQASLFACEVFYDKVKMIGRRSLARTYIDAYGAEFLYNISRPDYPIEKLEHMHNKLY